jgi:hypothetical protein
MTHAGIKHKAKGNGALDADGVLEVQGAAEDLRYEQHARVAFRTPDSSRKSTICVGLEAEDEDAYILTLAAPATIMRSLEPKLATLLEELEKRR